MLLNEMEIFYYAVELKSFSKAATRLGVSKSFVSKKISKLEQDLKVRLLARSTRKLILTAAGESFYRYCMNIVREGSEAYSMMNELHGKPSGLLRISIPPAIGLNLISPMIPEFLKQYPNVSLDIELDNKIVDLLKEGYDLALRSARLESSNLIAQRIFNIKYVICATEKYFKKHGMPKLPLDLTKHNCATYSHTKEAKYLSLTKNDDIEHVQIQGNVMSNQLDLIKKLVFDDLCIGILPEFMITEELQTRKLKPCLLTYKLPESPLYAVYPERKFMLPKLKCFLDMLKNYLKR